MTGVDAATRHKQFVEQGFHFPVEVLDVDDARVALAEYRRYELLCTRAGGFLSMHRRFPKVHLVAGWADGFVHNEHILDAVEALLGLDVLVWATQLFVRPAHSGDSLAWHQDALYFGLSGMEAGSVRVWVALTPTRPENGTMRYLPGSHRDGLMEHRRAETAAAGTLRGEEVVLHVDEEAAIDVVLEAGQASMHHLAIAHCSGPNQTDEDRVNLAIDYVAPSVAPVEGRDSALLVRGRDPYGNFEREERLAAEFDADALRSFQQATVLRVRRLQQALTARK